MTRDWGYIIFDLRRRNARELFVASFDGDLFIPRHDKTIAKRGRVKTVAHYPFRQYAFYRGGTIPAGLAHRANCISDTEIVGMKKLFDLGEYDELEKAAKALLDTRIKRVGASYEITYPSHLYHGYNIEIVEMTPTGYRGLIRGQSCDIEADILFADVE